MSFLSININSFLHLDIADIMRNQNRAFIALSNKVASLHDAVNTEKNYYYQYLKMYS
jgi:hypothetical protein